MAQKKKFIDVKAPILDETIEVLGTPEELNKKTIKLDLSRKLRGRGIEMILEIQKEEKTLSAYPKRIELVKAYIRRMIRKKISTVEDSFTIKFKDIEATIKPLLITRKKVSRVIRHNLRKNCRDILIEIANQKNYLEFAEDVLYGGIQKEIYPKLKKIYPLSLCEIRVLETKKIEKAEKNIPKKEQTSKETPPIEEELDNNISPSASSSESEKSNDEQSLEEIDNSEEEKKVVKKTTKKKVSKK